MSLRVAIETPARAEIRRIAHTPVPLAVAANKAFDRKRKADTLAQATRGHASHTDVRASSALRVPAAKWPTATRRDQSLTGDPHGRFKAEEAQRAKWLQELQQVVHTAKLPVLDIAARMSDPNVLLSALGRGRRWRTLRRMILDWERAARFINVLSICHGHHVLRKSLTFWVC